MTTINIRTKKPLTRQQQSLLALLLKNSPNLVTHTQIAQYVGGYTGSPRYDHEYSRSLTHRLRERLENPDMIVNVSGIGYKIVVEE
jgi:DNA-binding response OmpR family regulator